MGKGKDVTNFFEQEWQMFKNKSPRHVRRSSRSFSHLTKQSTPTLVPHSALFAGIRVTSGRNALKDINRVAQLVGLLPTSFENVLNVTLCPSKGRCNGSPHVLTILIILFNNPRVIPSLGVRRLSPSTRLELQHFQIICPSKIQFTLSP